MFEVYEIKQFKGEYNWLSNMSAIKPFIEDGISYNSVENYYQAMKTLSIGRRLQISKMKPHDSKSVGRALTLRDDWEDVKDDVMRKALEIKFGQIYYKNLLINTGIMEIVEGNYWNDKYWGFCLKTNKGQNKLGQFITEIRTRIFEEFDSRTLMIDNFPYIKKSLDDHDYKHMDKAVIRLYQNNFIINNYSELDLMTIEELLENNTYDQIVYKFENENILASSVNDPEKLRLFKIYQTVVGFISNFKEYVKQTNLSIYIVESK